jgi:hypothetical protein
MRTKDDFHKLIDKIEDEALLKSYFDLIKRLNENQTGVLWNSLNANEQKELLVSYEESLDTKNQISHSDAKKGFEKWLKK